MKATCCAYEIERRPGSEKSTSTSPSIDPTPRLALNEEDDETDMMVSSEGTLEGGSADTNEGRPRTISEGLAEKRRMRRFRSVEWLRAGWH